MNRGLPSSAFALAFGYVAFGFVALILFAAPLWYAWQVTVQDGRAELLRSDATRLSDVFRREGPQGLVTFINTRVGMQIAGERILLFADGSLHPLAGNLQEWPRGIPREAGLYSQTIQLDNQPARAMFEHVALPGGYNLLVGRDYGRFAPLERRFWYGLGGAVVVLSIAGVLAGFLIRRAVLLRVNGLQQTVQAIVQGDLSHRLPMHRSGDELDTLSRTINGMLDQIEHLVDGVRQVSNSIAHDLRTPLAELRSRLEELSLTRPDVEATFAEIEGAVADVDRVIGVFDALLRLAEIDSGMRRSGFVQVNAAELVRQAVEFYQPAAEIQGRHLLFRTEGPVAVAGDPVLLAQAIGNLIDNALKYSTDQGSIVVEARVGERGSALIVVADKGPGIPDEEKPKVSKRFYRGDASRGTPGVGLGLSLVDSVAKVHGGRLDLADNHPGLRATMTIAPGAFWPATAALPTEIPSSSAKEPAADQPTFRHSKATVWHGKATSDRPSVIDVQVMPYDR